MDDWVFSLNLSKICKIHKLSKSICEVTFSAGNAKLSQIFIRRRKPLKNAYQIAFRYTTFHSFSNIKTYSLIPRFLKTIYRVSHSKIVRKTRKIHWLLALVTKAQIQYLIYVFTYGLCNDSLIYVCIGVNIRIWPILQF